MVGGLIGDQYSGDFIKMPSTWDYPLPVLLSRHAAIDPKVTVWYPGTPCCPNLYHDDPIQRINSALSLYSGLSGSIRSTGVGLSYLPNARNSLHSLTHR